MPLVSPYWIKLNSPATPYACVTSPHLANISPPHTSNMSMVAATYIPEVILIELKSSAPHPCVPQFVLWGCISWGLEGGGMRIGIWCFSSCLRHTPTLPQSNSRPNWEDFPICTPCLFLWQANSTREWPRPPEKSKSAKYFTILFGRLFLIFSKRFFRWSRTFRRCEIPF